MVTNKMSHELKQKQINTEIKKSKQFLSIISTLVLGFLMFFNSCQKTDTTDQTQADAAVVSDFLKMSVASTTCTKDSADTLHRHSRLDITDIAVSALPVSITSYISTNYVGASIHKAELESDGTYKVLIVLTDNSFIGLSFDASGNFIAAISVKEKSGRKKGKKH